MPTFPRPVDQPPTSARGRYLATVKRNTLICTDHYRLELSLPRFPKSHPGQFIQIECIDPQHAASNPSAPITFQWPPSSPAFPPRPSDPDFCAPLPYLRRPFSIAAHQVWPDAYTELTILHRVVGKGTHALALLKPDDPVSILGPLGVGFTIPRDLHFACLVGGGVGIPPMFYLAKHFWRTGFGSAVAFVGAQRRDLLPLTFTELDENRIPIGSADGHHIFNVEEFAENGVPTSIATDDGSLGDHGFVTKPLTAFLEDQKKHLGDLSKGVVYCCGPTPMMKATAKVAAHFGVQCQLSLEQPMACGMGTCQSCIIRHKPHTAPPEQDWKYKLTCTDGPVFDARDIVW